MATAIGRVDEIVKDYLIYRGLTGTLRTFEQELRIEKEKGFRVDKIVEQLQSYALTYDLPNLRDYWNFLNNRLFSRLEQRYATSVRKLEIGLLKLYLVNASQNNRQDKIMDFFDKTTELLQSQAEFKEWFVFPFVRNPKENSHFSTCFTQQWQDTLFLSLHNFLSVVLQCMPSPILLSFETELRQYKELHKENEALKKQIQSLGEKPVTDSKTSTKDSWQFAHSNMDMVYDFSSLGEDTTLPETPDKSYKKFPFTSSALGLGRKKDKPHVLPRKRDDQIRLSTIPTPKAPKNTKLLPVITRQKKFVRVVPNVELTNQNAVDSISNNQNLSDMASTNQKLKKIDDAIQRRKELLESTGDKQKKNEDKFSDIQVSPSVSSKSLCQDVAPPSSILSTELTRKSEEILTFSPSTSSLSSLISNENAPEGDQNFQESVPELPFILLSQDTYSEHRSSVSYARFSNSGQYVASVDVVGVVKVWTWSPEAKTAATVMSKSAFLCLEWANKSDRWLLLGNKSGNIRLFDVKEMKSFYEATADTCCPRIVCLCSNPGAPMFACSATSSISSSDMGPSSSNTKFGKLTLWDLKTMKTDRQLPLEPDPVCINVCAFNHNGQLLVTGGSDGLIRIFDVGQQRSISQWVAHQGDVRSILFSADYNSCYSLGSDGKLIEWSMHKTGHMLQDLPIQQQGAAATHVLQSPDANGAKDNLTGKLLALDGDGGYLLACNDTCADIYKITKPSPGMVPLMNIKSKSTGVTTVDWSPNIDTKICLTGYLDGNIVISTLLSQ